MNKLKEKLKKRSGFTLVEMLIVVAIIAILIAVSVPMLSSTLEKARHSVDDANYRAAAGLANTLVLTYGKGAAGTYTYKVDPKNSQGYLAPPADNDVGKDSNYTSTEPANAKEVTAECTCDGGRSTGDGSESKPNAKLTVTIDAAGKVTLNWATG